MLNGEPKSKLLSYLIVIAIVVFTVSNVSSVINQNNVKTIKASEFLTYLENDGIKEMHICNGDGTVVGRGKPEIYINNKKVRDDSELDRLRADEILLAEIITNPGVEYGAEVKSVIRIKTIRKCRFELPYQKRYGLFCQGVSGGK